MIRAVVLLCLLSASALGSDRLATKSIEGVFQAPNESESAAVQPPPDQPIEPASPQLPSLNSSPAAENENLAIELPAAPRSLGTSFLLQAEEPSSSPSPETQEEQPAAPPAENENAPPDSLQPPGPDLTPPAIETPPRLPASTLSEVPVPENAAAAAPTAAPDNLPPDIDPELPEDPGTGLTDGQSIGMSQLGQPFDAEHRADLLLQALTRLSSVTTMSGLRDVLQKLGLQAIGSMAQITSLPKTPHETSAMELVQARIGDYAKKMEAAYAKLLPLPGPVNGNKVMEGYEEERTNLMSMIPAAVDFFKNPLDAAKRDALTKQCAVSKPESFYKKLSMSIPSEGRCNEGSDCWLDARNGLPSLVAYSTTAVRQDLMGAADFVAWTKVLLQDGLLGADFSVGCYALKGSAAGSVNDATSSATSIFTNTLQSLVRFYNQQMLSTYVWRRIQKDISAALHTSDYNGPKASNLQDTLTRKYGNFLIWSDVIVMNGGAGSDKQSYTVSACSQSAAAGHRCSFRGGAIAGSFNDNVFNSFIIFFRPRVGPRRSTLAWDAVTHASYACTTFLETGKSDVLELQGMKPVGDIHSVVQCLDTVIRSHAKAPSRGIFCAHSGGGSELAAVSDASDVMWIALPASPGSFHNVPDVGCWVHPPAVR